MIRTPLRKLLLASVLSGSPAVEDTATGNPVTFLTDLAKPLKSLIANFLPIQSGTGDPSPTNIRPITGWTGLDVKHFGENVIEINRNTETTVNGLTFTPVKDSNNKTVAIKVKGTSNSNNTFFNLNYVAGQVAFPIGTYKVSGYTDKVSFRVYALVDGVDTKIYDSASQTEFEITSSMTQAHMRLQISNSGTVVDETIYPIVVPSSETIDIYPVTWSTHGTIYGGFVDLVTGEVWGTHKLFTANSSTMNNSENYPGWKNCGVRAEGAKGGRFSGAFVNVGKVYAVNVNDNLDIIYLPKENYSDMTQSDWIALAIDIQIAYELATPTLITTLTPQQINALKGNNTVWSDGNGDCEVTFLKKG